MVKAILQTMDGARSVSFWHDDSGTVVDQIDVTNKGKITISKWRGAATWSAVGKIRGDSISWTRGYNLDRGVKTREELARVVQHVLKNLMPRIEADPAALRYLTMPTYLLLAASAAEAARQNPRRRR